ncbi:MAG: hypothetical protein PHF50_01530 [Patescibacteria group bacterium]|nr:hypothetical protein [Patescibacteria group bacterium]
MKKFILLGLLVVLLLGAGSFAMFKVKTAKKILGPEEAKATAEKFINENLLAAGATATIKNVTDEGDVYNISLNVGGQDYTSYMSKDGSKFFQSGINMTTFAEEQKAQAAASADNTQAAPAAEVPKSDKPKVELYVFTYCPYGTQSEKGIIPAVKLLGSKIDFKIRQIGAMHGDHEKIEAQRQLCIEKKYPAKYLDYTLAFALDSGIGACDSDAQCSEPLVSALFAKLGISKSTIDACIKTDGASLYAAEEANSQAKGIGGSPTLVINGVQSSAGRDSAAYLAGICAAFNNVPAECSQQLSSASPAAGFGAGSATGGSDASCQ